MKRRKPSPNSGKAEEKPQAQEPLQPKYFETEPVAESGASAAEAEPETTVPESTEANVSEPTGEGRGGQRPSRRRRGRGGRGRSKPRPKPVAADQGVDAAPAAVGTAGPLPPPEPDAEAAPVFSEPAPAPVPSPPASTPHAGRASKGTVVLAIGLPGSGKSSWFKRHNIHPLSSDLLRQLLFDNAEEQRFQDLVFSNLRSMLKARLIARRPMNYVDATNLTPHDRRNWIKLAKDFGYDVQGVFFDVPLEVCLERNRKRNRTVGEDVMRKMASKLRPPTFDEGFSKITVVRVKKKDDIPAD